MAKKTTEAGFIDLGHEYDSPVCCNPDGESKDGEKHVSYPSLWIRDVDIEKPEGDFTFVGKGRVVSWSEREHKVDGKMKKTFECEIEVTEMKIEDGAAPAKSKKRDAGDDLDSALTSIKSAETDVDDDEE